MYAVNRQAMIIAPKPALIEWVNSMFPEEEPLSSADPLTHDIADVYLIPEFDDIDESLEWLEENFQYFFEDQLEGWTEGEEYWPELTWDNFQQFLHISIQSLVVDSLEDELEKEGDIDEMLEM